MDSAIERIELLLVDLPPPVPRSDAIQSFVVQETPTVRITCADGSEGTGYAYTIGTGGGRSTSSSSTRSIADSITLRLPSIWAATTPPSAHT